MNNYFKKELPDYYPTMYLDGYTPTEIWTAHRKTIRKKHEEMLAERDVVTDINIKSDIKVK